MRSVTPIVLALAALLAASPATAGEGCGDARKAEAAVERIFTSADADGDGRLTRAEYEGAELTRYGLPFEASDLDADGATTRDEYLEIYRKHHPVTDETEV